MFITVMPTRNVDSSLRPTLLPPGHHHHKSNWCAGLLTVIVFATVLASGLADGSPTYCAYSKEKAVRVSNLEESEDGLEAIGILTEEANQEWLDSGRQVCPQGRGCYTLWQEVIVAVAQTTAENTTTNITGGYEATTTAPVATAATAPGASLVILAQGCWETSSENECLTEPCISKKRPSKSGLNSTKFCCCQGSLCNLNFTDGYDPANDTDLDQTLGRSAFHSVASASTPLTVIICASFAFLVLTLSGVLLFTCKICLRNERKKKRGDLDSLHLTESQSSRLSLSYPNYDLDTLKLEQLIGHGRYGSVYKGTLNGQTVASKVFTQSNKQYYINERDIYLLPFMEHPGLPRFYGADENQVEDGNPPRVEYRLVISCAPHGCLQGHLRANTIDWLTLCRMIQSLSAALAYLHSEVGKGDKVKPCIAHRDLSSRNVLVKEDLSLAICDFGFALKMTGSKCVINGVEQSAENTSLTDVGTLRYMAPEVLEGAVNLRDCETSLKQIDVYAMSLIMWEIASRCAELYQGMPVPDYKQPYEGDLGGQPTYEQMQVTVTRQKSRPLFPDVWKDTNPAIKTLKETITECWDHDGEARLTAPSVEERVLELPILWERHKLALVSGHNHLSHLPLPTILAASGISITSHASNSLSSAFNNQKNVLSLRNNASAASSQTGADGHHHAQTLLVANPYKVTNQLNVTREVVSGPPVEIAPQNEKNVLSAAANAFNRQQQFQVTFPLQPYQGRNPCLERNLMQNISDDGNDKLLEQGLKFRPANNQSVSDSGSSASTWSDTRCLVPRNQYSSSSTDSTAQRLSHSRPQRPGPIPITIQNAISGVYIPKQPNLPTGGGHRIPLTNQLTNVSNVVDSSSAEHSTLSAGGSLVSRLRNWVKSSSSGRSSLLNRRRSNDGAVEETEPLSSGSNFAVVSPRSLEAQQQQQVTQPTNHNLHHSTEQSNINLNTDSVHDTQVSMENGSPQTTLLNDSPPMDTHHASDHLNATNAKNIA